MYTSPQTTYTPRLCDILEYGFDLGLRDYPIYDEGDRERLNQAIVNHFYYREIAYETPSIFVMELNRRMAEEMPQINRVHDALETLDPWTTSESESETSGTANGTNEGSEEATSDSAAHTYNSNAPQVSMQGKDAPSYWDTGTYNDTTGKSGSTSSGQTTSESASTSKAKSRQGIPSDLIAAYYEGYNNTDLIVFDKLEVCFSHLYSNSVAAW